MAINKFFIRYKFSDAKLNVVLQDLKRKTDELIDYTLSIDWGNLGLYDTDKSDVLTLKWDEDDSNPRDFKFKVNKGDRTIDLSGNLTVELASILNQDLTTDASVIFAGLTINEAGIDKDFRVEGVDYTHLLFTDASTNRVGVNEDVPKALFHIRGATCTDYAGLHLDTILLIENDDNVYIQLQGSTGSQAGIIFADNDYNPPAGLVRYDFANEQMEFGIGTNEKVVFKSSHAVFNYGYIHLDSPTTYAVFVADSHNADSYVEYKEDGATKWTAGFDYTDSFKYQISEGVPGTNVRFEIASGGAVTISGTITFSSIAAGASDYDKFLVSDSGLVKYRTGVQVLSDIDGQPLDTTLTALAGLSTSADKYIRVTGTDTFDLRTYANVLSDIGGAGSGANSDITSMSGITGTITTPTNLANKTTAAWNKSIGSGGDYADWATMIDNMSNLIAYSVTVTIEAGTTLTEICDIKNKHGILSEGIIMCNAEKYYPLDTGVPTTDSATATTLRDAELATAAFGDDYFNGCWVRIIDGTGTDNGYVLITDYVDATGDVVVAAWSGTQPDNTSKYIIVGALIDGGGSRAFCLDIRNNTVPIIFRGVGFSGSDSRGVYVSRNKGEITFYECGFCDSDRAGLYVLDSVGNAYYCGFVNNNTDNNAFTGGIRLINKTLFSISYSYLSDNNQRGIIAEGDSYLVAISLGGDGNGNWGIYAQTSAQANISGTECSGSSGNHSDAGTAGDNSADQAAAY